VTDGEEEETPGEPDRMVSQRHVKANVRRYLSIHLLVRFPWWSVRRSGVGGEGDAAVAESSGAFLSTEQRPHILERTS